MKYAIIDISSSSLSLLIANKTSGTAFIVEKRQRENLSVLQYADGGILSERGVEKIADCLQRLKDVCKANEVDKCYVISTASIRNFKNFKWVSAEIKRRAAVTVNLLKGEEEALCDYVANEEYAAIEKGVLIDLGGGSIEICALENGQATSLQCHEFGPIQLNKRFVSDIHPTKEESKEIKKYVKKKLDIGEEQTAYSTAVLVGATSQAICRLYNDYYSNSEKNVLEYERLKKLRKHLLTSSERSMLILKSAPEKIYTLVTATVILCAILKHYGVEKAIISEYGVKEGFLQRVLNGEKKYARTSDLSEVPQAAIDALKLPEKKKKKKEGQNGKNE